MTKNKTHTPQKRVSWIVSLRIVIPVVLTLVLFAVSVFFIFIPSLEQQMMAQKKEMIRNLTDSVWSLLAEYEETGDMNGLSRKEVQSRAMRRIGQMRYGPEEKNYFWINDMHPRMIMHPYRKDLEGKELSGYASSDGEHLYAEYIQKLKEKGSGYMDYLWQSLDNAGRTEPKISYVKAFEPWGWVVGTGISVKDVRTEIAATTKRLALIFMGILTIVAPLLLYVVWQTVRFERERRRAQNDLLENQQNYEALYRESKKEEELYRSLLRSSADAIVIYDINGKVQYVSPAFTQMFGWTLEEVTGQRIPFVPEPEMSGTFSIIQGLVDHGTPCQGFETKRYTKDGRMLDVSISASRYDDHQGKPAGMLVMLRDISERKNLEAQIQQAQKMESIGTLAGGIAHNFNNLLMAIQGNVSLLRMDKDREDPDNKRLKNIEKCVKDGSNLAQQLLGFARAGKYEVRAADLNVLIQKTTEMFESARKEIRFQVDYEKDLWNVKVDQGQIEQVLLNMYVNGWQAMPEGGALFVETRNIQLKDPFAQRHGVLPGKYVQVSITDTGTGMDRATMERIFDPFFTTKEVGQGTGLGLASAYGIIKNHKGCIDVHSVQGEGSTFTLYLPATGPIETAEHPLLGATGGMPTGTGTILLVDDEEMVTEVGRDMLQHLGYDVLAAGSGKEALEMYTDHQDAVNLVILDMVMPDMSGSTTYDRLKEMDPTIKVLLSTGYSLDGPAEEILERGCNGFIQKPFDMQELSNRIQEVMSEPLEG